MSEVNFKTIGRQVAELISTAEVLATENAAVVEAPVVGEGSFVVRLNLYGFRDKTVAEMVADQINTRLRFCARTVTEQAKEILGTVNVDLLA